MSCTRQVPVASPTIKCQLPVVEVFPDLEPEASTTSKGVSGVIITDTKIRELFVWVKDTQAYEDKALQCIANRGGL